MKENKVKITMGKTEEEIYHMWAKNWIKGVIKRAEFIDVKVLKRKPKKKALEWVLKNKSGKGN